MEEKTYEEILEILQKMSELEKRREATEIAVASIPIEDISQLDWDDVRKLSLIFKIYCESAKAPETDDEEKKLVSNLCKISELYKNDGITKIKEVELLEKSFKEMCSTISYYYYENLRLHILSEILEPGEDTERRERDFPVYELLGSYDSIDEEKMNLLSNCTDTIRCNEALDILYSVKGRDKEKIEILRAVIEASWREKKEDNWEMLNVAEYLDQISEMDEEMAGKINDIMQNIGKLGTSFWREVDQEELNVLLDIKNNNIKGPLLKQYFPKCNFEQKVKILNKEDQVLRKIYGVSPKQVEINDDSQYDNIELWMESKLLERADKKNAIMKSFDKRGSYTTVKKKDLTPEKVADLVCIMKMLMGSSTRISYRKHDFAKIEINYKDIKRFDDQFDTEKYDMSNSDEMITQVLNTIGVTIKDKELEQPSFPNVAFSDVAALASIARLPDFESTIAKMVDEKSPEKDDQLQEGEEGPEQQ